MLTNFKFKKNTSLSPARPGCPLVGRQGGFGAQGLARRAADLAAIRLPQSHS
jgi:hypothetical protein